MKEIKSGNFSAFVLDKNNHEQLIEVQRLRYLYLLKEYNDSLPFDGLDDDGLDRSSDLLVVRDESCNKIVGTYRVTTPLTNTYNDKYLVERQYNIDNLKKTNEVFACVSRACVHGDYRNGVVIKLLFRILFEYIDFYKCKYTVGLCSFHGQDANKYKNVFSHAYYNYIYDDIKIDSTMNPVNLKMLDKDKINQEALKDEMPGLFKMYLKFGHKVVPYASIDKEFNSIDCFIILDKDLINRRYVDLFTK